MNSPLDQLHGLWITAPVGRAAAASPARREAIGSITSSRGSDSHQQYHRCMPNRSGQQNDLKAGLVCKNPSREKEQTQTVGKGTVLYIPVYHPSMQQHAEVMNILQL